jgi:hypothetical protein
VFSLCLGGGLGLLADGQIEPAALIWRFLFWFAEHL